MSPSTFGPQSSDPIDTTRPGTGRRGISKYSRSTPFGTSTIGRPGATRSTNSASTEETTPTASAARQAVASKRASARACCEKYARSAPRARLRRVSRSPVSKLC